MGEIKKVLLDDKINIENIKRYDIKTRAIILIIDELNLNNEFRWIEGKVFKEYEKKILKEKKRILHIFN